MKAKERMKNVVVEIKEPKIKTEEKAKTKFAGNRSSWKNRNDAKNNKKKFDGKKKFDSFNKKEKTGNEVNKKKSFSSKPRKTFKK